MSSNIVRIQIDLPEDKVKALEALMNEAQISTKKELFNNALTLLDWVVKEVRSGRVIASVNEATMAYKELAMPMLSAVTQNRAKQEEAEHVVTA